jgi:hypothetical protein
MSAAPPEVIALLRAAMPDLVALYREAMVPEPSGIVLVADGRETAPVEALLGGEELTVLLGCHAAAVVPLVTLRAVAEACTLDLARYLEEPLGPRSTWCLVLAPQGASLRQLVWAAERTTAPAIN